jgi:hypothetical protein
MVETNFIWQAWGWEEQRRSVAYLTVYFKAEGRREAAAAPPIKKALFALSVESADCQS